jgi:hypothetical protein
MRLLIRRLEFAVVERHAAVKQIIRCRVGSQDTPHSTNCYRGPPYKGESIKCASKNGVSHGCRQISDFRQCLPKRLKARNVGVLESALGDCSLKRDHPRMARRIGEKAQTRMEVGPPFATGSSLGSCSGIPTVRMKL